MQFVLTSPAVGRRRLRAAAVTWAAFWDSVGLVGYRPLAAWDGRAGRVVGAGGGRGALTAATLGTVKRFLVEPERCVTAVTPIVELEDPYIRNEHRLAVARLEELRYGSRQRKVSRLERSQSFASSWSLRRASLRDTEKRMAALTLRAPCPDGPFFRAGRIWWEAMPRGARCWLCHAGQAPHCSRRRGGKRDRSCAQRNAQCGSAAFRPTCSIRWKKPRSRVLCRGPSANCRRWRLRPMPAALRARSGGADQGRLACSLLRCRYRATRGLPPQGWGRTGLRAFRSWKRLSLRSGLSLVPSDVPQEVQCLIAPTSRQRFHCHAVRSISAPRMSIFR